MKNPSVYPDRTILTLLNLGVDAIKADLATATPGESVLDDILAVLPTDEERAFCEAYREAHKDEAIGQVADTLLYEDEKVKIWHICSLASSTTMSMYPSELRSPKVRSCS